MNARVVPLFVARVESEADPSRPGRTVYRVTGPNFKSVADALAVLRNSIDNSNGVYRFFGPSPLSRGYGAVGEIIIEPQGDAA